MTNDAYFDTPQAAMAQVVTDIGLSSNWHGNWLGNSPLQSIINSRRCVAALLIGDLPNWIVRTMVGTFDTTFVDIQFHPPHVGQKGDPGKLAHFHVRGVLRVNLETPVSNQGTYIQIQDMSRLHIRPCRTKPGCRDHYFIRNPRKNERDSKDFKEFCAILSTLLGKCWVNATDKGRDDYGVAKKAVETMRQVQGAWELEKDFVPDVKKNVELALKAMIPSAVILLVGNRVAQQALVQVGKKVGVTVLGKGIGLGVGKVAGGVGAFGGLATDVALEVIPGAKEAVGEGGRIGIGFAASAGMGAMVAGPVGAAVGAVGYGIGEGINQLFKLF